VTAAFIIVATVVLAFATRRELRRIGEEHEQG
jgi:hypothetical protein